MKSCIRCKINLIENLEVKVEASAYNLKIKEIGVFKPSLGQIFCGVCPSCGYVELYIKDVSKLEKISRD